MLVVQDEVSYDVFPIKPRSCDGGDEELTSLDISAVIDLAYIRVLAGICLRLA